MLGAQGTNHAFVVGMGDIAGPRTPYPIRVSLNRGVSFPQSDQASSSLLHVTELLKRLDAFGGLLRGITLAQKRFNRLCVGSRRRRVLSSVRHLEQWKLDKLKDQLAVECAGKKIRKEEDSGEGKGKTQLDRLGLQTGICGG